MKPYAATRLGNRWKRSLLTSVVAVARGAVPPTRSSSTAATFPLRSRVEEVIRNDALDAPGTPDPELTMLTAVQAK